MQKQYPRIKRFYVTTTIRREVVFSRIQI